MRLIARFLCLLTLWSGGAIAESLLPAPMTSALTADNASAPTFLPVHEAYQLQVTVQPDRLVLEWQIAEGYFLYGEQFHFGLFSGDQSLPLVIERGQGEIAYDDYFEKEVEKFRFTTTQALRWESGADPLILRIGYQGCADAGLCYPPETLTYRIDIARRQATRLANETASAVVDVPASAHSFALMFVFAFLGGLILNLMPCVFPVLTLKLMGFARSNQGDSHVREHSWFYTLGVLSTFLLTALALIWLRKSGDAIGWGFQLQSPWFIGALALLFLVLGLSMSGFITLGTRWMGVGEQLTAGNHYHNSFFTGVLAVIVASPCSVPFMGVALGYALTQPLYASLVIFAGLGFGLASPFLVFAYAPWLIKHLPRPGAWMETLKHWLALPLYLSALWLLWVLWNQVMDTSAQVPENQPWEKYSAQVLEDYRAFGEPVFVELTADWCITCLVNEKVALMRPAVQEKMKTDGIHYLRGDWTNRDPEITELLKQHQRAGVPLYLYYNRNGQLTLLPQILTEQIVLDALDNR